MARMEDQEQRAYERRLAAQRAAAEQAARAKQAAAMAAQHLPVVTRADQGGAMPAQQGGGWGASQAGMTPYQQTQGWMQAFGGLPDYGKFKQTRLPTIGSGARSGWDLIRRAAEITGISNPMLMPVLQSRLPEGAAPARAPQYGGTSYAGGSSGWGGGYSGGGGGGSNWGSYPTPAASPLWWDPGLYNWRYGASY